MPNLSGLTVTELIEVLSEIPEEQKNLRVVFACDYGDYSHTQQALPVTSLDHSKTLVESAYSRSGWALPSDDEDQNLEYVVVLS